VLARSVMDYMTAKIGPNEQHNQSLTLWAEQATDKWLCSHLIPKVSRIHPGFSQQNQTLQVKPPTNASVHLGVYVATREYYSGTMATGIYCCHSNSEHGFLDLLWVWKMLPTHNEEVLSPSFFSSNNGLGVLFQQLPFHMGRRLVLWECVRVGGRLQTLVLYHWKSIWRRCIMLMKLASQLTRSGSISSSEAAMSSLSDEVQGQVSAITRTIVHTTS